MNFSFLAPSLILFSVILCSTLPGLDNQCRKSVEEAMSTPPPGSPEAIRRGCLCPVADKYPDCKEGTPVYIINPSCPMHGNTLHQEKEHIG